jgi:succinate dehydrogenase/fumarate reductase flavoprotein subunit
MKKEPKHFGQHQIQFIETKVAVVGSGAAALNAAVQLTRKGIKDIVLVTEKLGAGTSANAGSDKQTYCRLNPSSGSPDSVTEMARDLFAGSCMHGNIALVEAALSQRAFFNLVELGVPFPQNRYGECVGFQTDHDNRSRGTSAGPKTSILMVEKLLAEARQREVQILDHCTIIDLLTLQKGTRQQIAGLLALIDSEPVIIKAEYVVYGTGGPGALYYDSVYPVSQLGSLGIALKAGARAQNLTESQFGLASTQFRWNLSGSYQQVLPRYISTEFDGSDEQAFLTDHFPTIEKLLEAQFLKGYQWPFDVRKINGFGSSLIDLLVYIETREKGRKVFLDYRQNPVQDYWDFASLPLFVKDYLEQSQSTAPTPIQRLKQMNFPAYELYRENGIDLEKQPLEIAVCHQHCNGGLSGSIWWESSISNFFPVGECNGTHGLYRPGGSALNSGQVGSIRAAEMIDYRLKMEPRFSLQEFREELTETISNKIKAIKSLASSQNGLDPSIERDQIQRRMSDTLGIVRNADKIAKALRQNHKMREEHLQRGVRSKKEITAFIKNEDLLITEQAFLESAQTLSTHLRNGRGSYLLGRLEEVIPVLTDNQKKLDELPDHSLDGAIIQFQFGPTGEPETKLERVRPIPETDNWFEKVWKDFRGNKQFNPESETDHG